MHMMRAESAIGASGIYVGRIVAYVWLRPRMQRSG
jgi:hypothetical protein